MSLKVTVCGSSGGYAGAGRACAGFLLSNEENTLMLDIGPGALSNMLAYLDADALDALLLTHMHYDHYVDVFGLCTARRFWETDLPALPVMAPGIARDVIGSPLAEKSREEFFKCLEFITPEPGKAVDLAGFEVTTLPSRHGVDGLICRLSAGGSTLCYSGDTDRCDELLELAGGADLFICESTFTSEVPVKQPGHLTATEAGAIAAEAGVGSLLLTHLWPTLDPARAVEEAGEQYNGPVELAIEGLTVFVGPYPCAV